MKTFDTHSEASIPETAISRLQRARAIARAGGLEAAIGDGALPRRFDTTLSEAIVLGLLRQEVRTFVTVFGHGSTELGEVLRLYEEAGVLRTVGVRSEIEASHAAAALRWVSGEKAAVVTSIGPGAMQAMAASLMPASNGLGVWYLFGDETTEDEGPNMQQIPKHQQSLFLKLCSTMGESYTLHTPAALGTALRRGLSTVDHPYRAGPFFLLMPMNQQPAPILEFNVEELPLGTPPKMGAAADDESYAEAARLLLEADRVVVKVGGGARGAGPELLELLELIDGVAVTSPLVSGVIPYGHPRNMCVGGSKGSICGNYAMEKADLALIIGARAVCQSDSSRTGYLEARHVININADMRAAMHYGRTLALVGDAACTLRKLNETIRGTLRGADKTLRHGSGRDPHFGIIPNKINMLSGFPDSTHIGHQGSPSSNWFRACTEKRREWEAFKAERQASYRLYDEMWQREVLTQPAAIKAATDWARAHDVVTFFDAGDVQANGFQVVEDDRLGRTFTDTGASYMGFAASALLSSALSRNPFYGLAISGDGSFMMNPQILIDGVSHGARGCILLLDNRRMAAISGLQKAQYGHEHATFDGVPVDYVALAGAIDGVNAVHGGFSPEELVSALEQAQAHEGLSLIHLPIYYGDHPMGGLGAFGRWNVGNWVESTQALRHEIGL